MAVAAGAAAFAVALASMLCLQPEEWQVSRFGILGAQLLKHFGADLQKSRVTLSAADKGSGSLLEYYSDKYGLGVVEGRSYAEGSHRMAGPLLQALQRCDAVWGMPAVQERSHEHLVL